MAAATKRSPFKVDHRSLRENQRATTKYTMEKTCNPRVLADGYIEGLKTAYGIAAWDSIANDPDVRTAMSNVATMGYSHSDAFYHAVSYMLNRISFAYLQSEGVSMDAVDTLVLVFSAPTNSAVLGDYLGVAAKADLLAFMDTPAALTAALQATSDNRYVVVPDWVHVLGIGEWKDGSGRTGQFLWYLVALKRYRPDLVTAYGLLVEKGKVSLTALNPCGSWMSNAVPIAFPRDHKRTDGGPIPAADTWIAYVILLYQAHAGRDARFKSLTGAADGFARWNIDLVTHAPLVRPFHATYGPGRMSWFSFELDASPNEPPTSPNEPPTSPNEPPTSPNEPPSAPLAKGFVKVSWQDTAANFNETSLLEVAHRNTWLPGLVRHWTAVRDDSEEDLVTLWGHSPGGKAITRVKEIVYLASVGQPLSQCRSVSHLLEVVYDAVQVHFEMLERGIIHGDISWFNLLCNPWHDPDTERSGKLVADDVPCIQYILTGDKANSRPRALVLDLDHGALTKVLYAPGYKGRKEKSGTPMFVSVELSSKSAIDVGWMDPVFLVAQLRRAENDSELFNRAFPKGDGKFMDNFLRVVELEQERSRNGEYANTRPEEPHRPHHDMESFYWILTWAFSRACPLGFDPHGNLDDAFSEFADRMLEHKLNSEQTRFDKLYGSGVPQTVFHPELRPFVPLIRNIARYLAIPWNRYMHIVQPDHAHIAIRRLMLPWIHELAVGKRNDVAFNTAQPRTIRVSESKVRDRLSPVQRHTPSAAPAVLGSRRGTQPVSEGFSPLVAPGDMPVQASIPNSATAESAPPSAVLRGSDSVGFSAPGPETRGSKRRADAQDDASPPEPKRTKKPVDPPAPVTPRDERDVAALIEMFWADRALWFGNGFRNLRDFRSAERAEEAQQA